MSPPPPDLNVESAWLTRSGFEVRNKRAVYVTAFVVPKWRFNIEIEGAGGSPTARNNRLGVFFAPQNHSLPATQFNIEIGGRGGQPTA